MRSKKSRFALWLVACAGIATAFTGSAAGASKDRTDAALDRCLAAAENASTGGQTDCEAVAERSYDKRMNQAYADLMRRLPASAADRLRQSQRAWLLFRDAESRARGAVFATRQGSMYAPMQGDAGAAVVGDRARMLERYLRILDIE